MFSRKFWSSEDQNFKRVSRSYFTLDGSGAEKC